MVSLCCSSSSTKQAAPERTVRSLAQHDVLTLVPFWTDKPTIKGEKVPTCNSAAFAKFSLGSLNFSWLFSGFLWICSKFCRFPLGFLWICSGFCRFSSGLLRFSSGFPRVSSGFCGFPPGFPRGFLGFPPGLLRVSSGFPPRVSAVLLGFFSGFCRVSAVLLGFSRVFVGFCSGFSRVFVGFPRFCSGSPRVFLVVSSGFRGFPRESSGFPRVFLGFPRGALGFLRVYSGSPRVCGRQDDQLLRLAAGAHGPVPQADGRGALEARPWRFSISASLLVPSHLAVVVKPVLGSHFGW